MTENDDPPEATQEELADDTDLAESDSDDGLVPSSGARKPRRSRLFPGMSFHEALVLAEAIHKHASGFKVRRITLFEDMGRSPSSGAARALITASSQYGITVGSYSAEYLELTEKGRVASDLAAPERARLSAQIDLAVREIEPFRKVYEKLADSKLPSTSVLHDEFVQAGVPEASASEATDTFMANVRELGLVRTIAGAEWIVKAEAVLDDIQSVDVDDEVLETTAVVTLDNRVASKQVIHRRPASPAGGHLDDVCFIVSPIGAVGSEYRRHADLVLNSLIVPALEELNLRPIRADKISKPGLITGQVIEHIAHAALVIADLSYANPNVYYELALRHAVRKPVVQLIRAADQIPFDVGQYRTVTVDLTDIYTFVPQLELHRQEIRRQCRLAIQEGSPSQTQLSLFYPGFWDQIAQ